MAEKNVTLKDLIKDIDFRLTHLEDLEYDNRKLMIKLVKQGNTIVEFLKQLEVKALIEARVHMFISEFFKGKPSEWHIHYPFKAKTSILYLNTCDSGTELKINDEKIFIKQEANTMLIFDSDIYHRGTPSTEDDIRYLINFSYF